MTAPGFDFLLRAVPALAPAALRGLLSTSAFRVLNRGVERAYIAQRRPFVGTLWHKDILVALDYFRRRGFTVMVSRSRDGEVVARTMHRMGYRTVRGSSSAGGAEALREMTGALRSGGLAAVIADGPRGPARAAKLGCVYAARDSGGPLVPFGCHVSPALRLRNWDGTQVPLPFSRITVAFGEPVSVRAEASREECEEVRAGLDAAMAELEATCRRDAEGR
jgi:lysophospholipid acyltransferase (LPLAT)-like uncharacterized protein